MIKTTLKIQGMSCGMCEAHINDVIRRTFPEAKKVSSSHKRGEASFSTEKEIDGEIITKAIHDTGYEIISIESEIFRKKGLFGL